MGCGRRFGSAFRPPRPAPGTRRSRCGAALWRFPSTRGPKVLDTVGQASKTMLHSFTHPSPDYCPRRCVYTEAVKVAPLLCSVNQNYVDIRYRTAPGIRSMATPNLTYAYRAELARMLRQSIGADRFPLSPRLRRCWCRSWTPEPFHKNSVTLTRLSWGLGPLPAAGHP